MSILLFVIWLKNVDVQGLQFYNFNNHSPFPYSQDIYIILQHFISTTPFNTKCRNTCLVYVLNNYDTITYNFPPLMKIITLHTHTHRHTYVNLTLYARWFQFREKYFIILFQFHYMCS